MNSLGQGRYVKFVTWPVRASYGPTAEAALFAVPFEISKLSAIYKNVLIITCRIER